MWTIYDIRRDIYEKNDLYRQDDNLSRILRQKLLKFHAKKEWVFTKEFLFLFKEKPNPIRKEKDNLKTLKSLGYLQ
jgi:hypothetical protein